jgi:transcriptional regulator with XRE-family HTH domain
MSGAQRLLGPTIREARRQRGWSQERLAEAAGLDRSYVGEIERGLVSPTLLTLEKLSSALALTASELIGRCEARSTLCFSDGSAAAQRDGDSP